MIMPKDVLAEEKQMFVDVWEFRKKYYLPENNDEYWQAVIADADALIKKYPGNAYLHNALMVSVNDFEARGGKSNKKAWKAELDEGAEMPTQGSKYAAGFDLRTTQDLVIMPEEVAEVHTGFHLQPSKNVVGLLFMRSGLAKQGLRLATGVSVIDPDYTGEIIAYVHNAGNEIFRINKGDRICQLVFMRFVVPEFERVDKLPETQRGAGGFGSTGIK